MSAPTNIARGHRLLLELIDLCEELKHNPLATELRRALVAETARDAELILDRFQDLLRDIGRPVLARALTPIIEAYAAAGVQQ